MCCNASCGYGVQMNVSVKSENKPYEVMEHLLLSGKLETTAIMTLFRPIVGSGSADMKVIVCATLYCHDAVSHTVRSFGILQTYFGHLNCMPVVYMM